jgi:hypothetical protein
MAERVTHLPRLVEYPRATYLVASDGRSYQVHNRRVVNGRRRACDPLEAEYRLFESAYGELRRYDLAPRERRDLRPTLVDRQLQQARPYTLRTMPAPRHTVRPDTPLLLVIHQRLHERIERNRRLPLSRGSFPCPACDDRMQWEVSDAGYIAARCNTPDCLQLFECGGGADLDLDDDDNGKPLEELPEGVEILDDAEPFDLFLTT